MGETIEKPVTFQEFFREIVKFDYLHDIVEDIEVACNKAGLRPWSEITRIDDPFFKSESPERLSAIKASLQKVRKAASEDRPARIAELVRLLEE